MTPTLGLGAGGVRPGHLLLTCGGRWVGMVYQLREAMAKVPELAGGRVCVADSGVVAPAAVFGDASFRVPKIGDPGYVPALLELCRAEGIRVFLPLIDIDQARLAPHRAAFAEVGTALVCPDPDVMETCFDKGRFEAFAEAHGLRIPRTFSEAELDGAAYPLFFKPKQGFGSIGTGLASDPLDARRALERNPDLIFQEYLRGAEICVDGVVSRSGAILHAVQRVRDKVIGGESVVSHTVRREAIRSASEKVLGALAGLGFHGPFNLQFFEADEPVLFDANLRLGLGGSALSNVATRGHLFASVLQEACGALASPPATEYEEGLWMHKFLGDLFCTPQGELRDVWPSPPRASAGMSHGREEMQPNPIPPALGAG